MEVFQIPCALCSVSKILYITSEMNPPPICRTLGGSSPFRSRAKIRGIPGGNRSVGAEASSVSAVQISTRDRKMLYS
jgi:hypothetical protein